MAKKKSSRRTPSVEENIVSGDSKTRFKALRQATALPSNRAVPILKRGLAHWDRKLRNRCALELGSRMKGTAAALLLGEYVKGRIYASCSVDVLLKYEDHALISYLKATVRGKSDRSLVAAGVLRLTKHSRAISLEQQKRAKETEGERRAKEARARASAARGARWAPIVEEIKLFKELEEDSAKFLHGVWLREKSFDRLYKVHKIPKRYKGKRQIEEPAPVLKAAQRKFLELLTPMINLHPACHGFRKGFSIVTNATVHTGQKCVINLDIKNFFPTVNRARLFGMFKRLGISRVYGEFLVTLCTYQNRLPQGAPTSPMLANLICTNLDKRLAGLAAKAGARYTRYADDLTLSGGPNLNRYIPLMKTILTEEGFELALPKLRILRSGSRQVVTGLTVNQQVSVPRALRRRLRAAVHHASTRRVPHWKKSKMTPQVFMGHLSFLSSVHPEEARKLVGQLPRKWRNG